MEIILTYCPSDFEKNRICGHTFEVMDYYLLFTQLGYKAKILIQDSIEKNRLYKAWEDKYDNEYLDKNYKMDIIFKKSKIIKADILIFVDGLYNYYIDTYILKYKYLYIFRCNTKTNYKILLKNKNVFLFQDYRVYQDYHNYTNVINYVKKIKFDNYKKYSKTKTNKTLVYINSNLRKLETPLPKNRNYIYLSGTNLSKDYIKSLSIGFKDLIYAPVENLFEKFDEFLYTSTKFQFDCSPRFIAECQFYNKKVSFNFDIEKYFEIDTGLKWRWYDTINNFNNLVLNKEDLIIKYLKRICVPSAPSTFQAVSNEHTSYHIEFPITYKCNFNCEYCYAKEEISSINKDISLSSIISSINHLKTFSKNCSANIKKYLYLLGGEPTIHNNFKIILKLLLPLDDSFKIHLVTNSKNILKYKNELLKFKNLKITLSFHPTQMTTTDFLKILEKSFVVFNNKILIEPSIPDIMDSKKYKMDLQRIFNFCKKINIPIDYNIINSTEWYSAEKETKSFNIFNNLESNNDKFILNNIVYSYSEIVKNKLDNFFGWYCYSKVFKATDKGLKHACTNQDIKDLIDKPVICPFNKCECEYYLKGKKINDR